MVFKTLDRDAQTRQSALDPWRQFLKSTQAPSEPMDGARQRGYRAMSRTLLTILAQI